MRSNAKSSITLPPGEFRLVRSLNERLKLSNVEVVRRGLRLLEETTEREALRDAYRDQSRTIDNARFKRRLGAIRTLFLNEIKAKVRSLGDL